MDGGDGGDGDDYDQCFLSFFSFLNQDADSGFLVFRCRAGPECGRGGGGVIEEAMEVDNSSEGEEERGRLG